MSNIAFKNKIKEGRKIIEDQIARDQASTDYESAYTEDQHLNDLDSGKETVIDTSGQIPSSDSPV